MQTNAHVEDRERRVMGTRRLAGKNCTDDAVMAMVYGQHLLPAPSCAQSVCFNFRFRRLLQRSSIVVYRPDTGAASSRKIRAVIAACRGYYLVIRRDVLFLSCDIGNYITGPK